MLPLCWHFTKLFSSRPATTFSFPCHPCLWHTVHEKKVKSYAFSPRAYQEKSLLCGCGGLKTEGSESPSLYWATCWGLQYGERDSGKGRGKAVWTITLPHCSMEPCPVNSFHHGRVRRRPRGRGGKGGGDGEQWKMLPVWLDGCWLQSGKGSNLGHCGRSNERCTFLKMQIKNWFIVSSTWLWLRCYFTICFLLFGNHVA